MGMETWAWPPAGGAGWRRRYAGPVLTSLLSRASRALWTTQQQGLFAHRTASSLQANSVPPAVRRAELSPYLRADNVLLSSCRIRDSSSCFFSSDSCILEFGKIVARSWILQYIIIVGCRLLFRCVARSNDGQVQAPLIHFIEET